MRTTDLFMNSAAKNLIVRPFTAVILNAVEGFRVTTPRCQSYKIWGSVLLFHRQPLIAIWWLVGLGLVVTGNCVCVATQAGW